MRNACPKQPAPAPKMSDSATDFLRPPKHVISLLFWLWRTPEHIRFVFSLLLYRQILYNIVTRHGRSSQSRRTLRMPSAVSAPASPNSPPACGFCMARFPNVPASVANPIAIAPRAKGTRRYILWTALLARYARHAFGRRCRTRFARQLRRTRKYGDSLTRFRNWSGNASWQGRADHSPPPHRLCREGLPTF